MGNNQSFRLVQLRPRPDIVSISHGRTVLAVGEDGFMTSGRDHGLFVEQTRLLSHYRWLMGGDLPIPVTTSNCDQHSWLGYYITPPPPVRNKELLLDQASQNAIELRLSRLVDLGGIHEDVDLHNYTQQAVEFTLALELDADFADEKETHQARKQHGKIDRQWRQAAEQAWELNYDYHVQYEYDHQGDHGKAHLHRGLTIRIESKDSPAADQDGRVTFQVRLGPQGNWHACLKMIPILEGRPLAPPDHCRSFAGRQSEFTRRQQQFLKESTSFSTIGSDSLAVTVVKTLEQAKYDMAALRLYDLDKDEQAWIPSAGLPTYIGLFGRDSLISSSQAALLSPAMMRGTLPEIAHLQGTKDDPWRDEQPGRMLHQAQSGPLEILNFNPLARYYGTITTSPFYPMILAELWRWTGDADFIRPLLGPAVKAMRWLDDKCDLLGNGFYAYHTLSEQGLKNQSWKDSGDAIVYEDGSQVDDPIATCEVQGFAYGGKLALAELLGMLQGKDEGRQYHTQAQELKKRFDEVFWMKDEQFIALGLDPQGRPIRSISSNPGHCLLTGIVGEERARQVADRLLAEDMFSGWGIRTLSANHPAYNPYSYQRGTVWPVDQGFFALGCCRYGLHRQVEVIARAMFESAELFQHHRLPECFGGQPRDDDHPFPALYAKADWPQAWSASSVFAALQSMLGLYPYAPLEMLLLDPHLPSWLPEITLTGLHVGRAVAKIRFFRQARGRTDYEVLDLRGPLHVIRHENPWALATGRGEKVRERLNDLLSGARGR